MKSCKKLPGLLLWSRFPWNEVAVNDRIHALYMTSLESNRIDGLETHYCAITILRVWKNMSFYLRVCIVFSQNPPIAMNPHVNTIYLWYHGMIHRRSDYLALSLYQNPGTRTQKIDL